MVTNKTRGQARVPSGPRGPDHSVEVELAAKLDVASNSAATEIAIELGRHTGAAGLTALRAVMSREGPGSRAVKCAAIGAIVIRLGKDATPDMVQALRDRGWEVRHAAACLLVTSGTAAAWDDVFHWLSVVDKRVTKFLDAPETLVAVAYLLQHLDPDRERRLREEVHATWKHRTRWERNWFAKYWPAGAPGGNTSTPSPPDPADLRAWISNPVPMVSTGRGQQPQ
jgi:hypothetical protein